jgi:hypothetical protein
MRDPLEPYPEPAELPAFFDEKGRPDFREVYGRLLARATHVDVALTSIRVSTLNLGRGELERVGAIRLLLAELSAVHLDAEAHVVMQRPEQRETLSTVADQLSRGVIEVRSSPLGGWSPDFSIFRDGRRAQAVLIGFHSFERPFPYRGPAFVSLHTADAAERALTRFEDLWERAHDVGAAVLSILERASRPESLAPQGLAHPWTDRVPG